MSWKPFNVSGANIWVSDVSGFDEMPALHINGARATRARYPNMPSGIEASCGYGCMIEGGKGKWTPPDFQKYGNVIYYTDKTTQHYRNTTNDWFNEYMIGVGTGPERAPTKRSSCPEENVKLHYQRTNS